MLAGLPAGRAQDEWAAAHEEAWRCTEALQLVPSAAPTADTPCGLDLRLPTPASSADVHVRFLPRAEQPQRLVRVQRGRISM